MLTLHIRRHPTRRLTLAPAGSQIRIRILIRRIRAIQPQHITVMIVPKTHHKHHPIRQRLCHIRHAALILKRVRIAKRGFLLVAELGRDAVALDAGDRGRRLGERLAVLHVEALDFHGVACADELCDDCEFLGCVDRFPFAVEVFDTHAVAVEVAAVGVAYAGVAVSGICAAAAIAFAARLLDCGTRVGGYGCADGVCFPYVHFGTAGAVAADAGVGIVGRGGPAFDVALGNCQYAVSVWECWGDVPRR
jgi:hypothetical protein